jgi:hypothetical protein
MHDHIVFKPILIEDLLTVEKKHAMESFIFLTKKKDGKIKVRNCTNQSVQQDYTDCKEAAKKQQVLQQ